MVGAHNVVTPQKLNYDAFILPIASVWGWATWERAWNKFSWTPKNWPQIKGNPNWYHRFQLGGMYDYVSMLEMRLRDRNESWDVLWWYAITMNNGRIVYPSINLVLNNGCDGSGYHCGVIDRSEEFLSAGGAFRNGINFPPNTKYRNKDVIAYESALFKSLGLRRGFQIKIIFYFKKLFNWLRYSFKVV